MVDALSPQSTSLALCECPWWPTPIPYTVYRVTCPAPRLPCAQPPTHITHTHRQPFLPHTITRPALRILPMPTHSHDTLALPRHTLAGAPGVLTPHVRAHTHAMQCAPACAGPHTCYAVRPSMCGPTHMLCSAPHAWCAPIPHGPRVS